MTPEAARARKSTMEQIAEGQALYNATEINTQQKVLIY
jgi:hypothetical protein